MERVYFVMPTWPNISKDEEPRNIWDCAHFLIPSYSVWQSGLHELWPSRRAVVLVCIVTAPCGGQILSLPDYPGVLW